LAPSHRPLQWYRRSSSLRKEVPMDKAERRGEYRDFLRDPDEDDA
jgi:hypothetical protein